MFKKIRTTVPALALMALAACSQETNNPVAPSPADDAGNPSLSLQHLENLRAIERERQASNGRFDALTQAWNSRHDGGGPVRTNSTETFIPCAPLPFDGEAQIVGPAGGTFIFGPHKLIVPQGALSADVSIAVMVVTSLKTEVSLLPHGTQFAVPVKVQLAYGHCDNATTHRVAYIDENDNVIEWPSAIDRADLSYVEASLNHFSQYAIAY